MKDTLTAFRNDLQTIETIIELFGKFSTNTYDSKLSDTFDKFEKYMYDIESGLHDQLKEKENLMLNVASGK